MRLYLYRYNHYCIFSICFTYYQWIYNGHEYSNIYKFENRISVTFVFDREQRPITNSINSPSFVALCPPSSTIRTQGT